MKLAEDLKKAVLQAAMQGKLTEQKDTDSSVDELLQKITEEKAKLIKEGKIKKEKTLSEITDNDKPFDIPANWRWEKVGKLLGIARGGSPRPITSYLTNSEDGYNWIKIGDSEIGGKYINHTAEKIIKEGLYKTRLVHKGDLLLSNSMSFGRPYILNIDGCIHDGWLVLHDYSKTLNKEFLYYIFSSNFLKEQFFSKVSGAVVKNLNSDKVADTIVPLPPIEEQQRIVEKLNTILPLIDEYSKEEDELIDLCQKFPEEMKKSVLQAAMQGKLTEQKQDDSSVDELLQKITDEKEKLLKEGKIKKEKSLAEITEEEKPFDIPDNWRWTRLRNIVYSRGQKTPDRKFSYIDIGSINNQKQILSDKENILEAKDAPSRARKIVSRNDVLYSTVRPYLHNMCIIDKEFSAEPIASTGFAVMTCIHVLPEFLLKYLMSPDFDSYANDHENSKGVAYPAINDDKLYKAIIPLPPIEEQQRIVEKLNTILPIIDSMSVYGTKKKAGRPKEEEALAFINTLLNTTKKTKQKTDSSEIEMLKEKAKSELPEIVQNYAARMGLTYNRITIRHQKTRWGSCTKSGNLNFNCLIMKMPQNVRDYVIVHELAHLKELNHSSRFWSIVAQYCPDYKEATKWLKENGVKLI